MNTEPVLSAATLAGVISAGIIWARSMGWVDLSDDQFNNMMIFISLLLPILTGVWARAQVTPLSRPRDKDGNPLASFRS